VVSANAGTAAGTGTAVAAVGSSPSANAGTAAGTGTAASVTAGVATYYISPTGSGTAGTYAAPCALSRLAVAGVVQPGDVWVLLDGTYGTLALNGSSGVNDGTAAKPITVRAEHERLARLLGPGNSTVLDVANLAY
jgi:hypothetical protein